MQTDRCRAAEGGPFSFRKSEGGTLRNSELVGRPDSIARSHRGCCGCCGCCGRCCSCASSGSGPGRCALWRPPCPAYLPSVRPKFCAAPCRSDRRVCLTCAATAAPPFFAICSDSREVVPAIGGCASISGGRFRWGGHTTAPQPGHTGTTRCLRPRGGADPASATATAVSSLPEPEPLSEAQIPSDLFGRLRRGPSVIMPPHSRLYGESL